MARDDRNVRPAPQGARPLRVAHVIYSPALGGSEMIATEICSRLDRTRFEPLLVFMYDGAGPVPQLAADRGVPCERFRTTRLRRLLGPLLPAAALSRWGIDVLHVHHVPLWDRLQGAASLASVPVVLTEHAKFSISRSPALQRASRRAARQCVRFTTVSADLKAYFVDELGIDASRIEVVPNGVDTERFRPERDRSVLRELAPGLDGGRVLLAVGRLAEAKDHPTLFAALARLPHDVRLVVVGDGDLRGALEARAKELGVAERVVFAGTRTDVPRFLRAADAFVISSQREGLPMVLLEALSSGLPIVSTRVGGIGEVLADGTSGLLVPAGDPAALAGALQRVLDDAPFAARLGAAARAAAEASWSLASTVRHFESVYETAVGVAS